MIPILFDIDETDFTSNGLGRLECMTCTVTEERNGIYELDASIPVDGSHASDLVMDSIIGVIPHDGGTIQAFRVYKIEKPINGRFTVYARHISYQLLDIPTMPFSVLPDPTACATTLATLKTNAVETCPFDFETDVTTYGTYNQTVPAAIRSRLLGSEGSVLDQFGGEYEWDNWTVKLHHQRGRLAITTGITLRYGKNITDLNQEEEISNVVTGVVPYWKDNEGNLVVLPEKAVYSQYASAYPFHRTVPLDLSDKWEEAPTENTLRTAAQAFVNNSELGLPKVSIKVSFVALWQSEEYKDVLPLQRVQLCDEINVVFEKYGISRTAKIVKTVYNVLKERYVSIEVGSIRSSFTSVINDQEKENALAIAAQAVSTQTAINNATKWLTSAGGWVIAIKNADGTWKELVFSDNEDPYDIHANLLRINNNGIGFTRYKDAQHPGGLNGEYDQAWTIDGNLIADFIHGGTLTIGGNNNTNGWIKLINASGTEIGRWDNSGLISKGTSSGRLNDKVTISNGVISMTTTDGNNHDNIKIVSGNDELSIGLDTFYLKINGAFTQHDWSDLMKWLDWYLGNDGDNRHALQAVCDLYNAEHPWPY